MPDFLLVEPATSRDVIKGQKNVTTRWVNIVSISVAAMGIFINLKNSLPLAITAMLSISVWCRV